MKNCFCFVTHKYDNYIRDQLNKIILDLLGNDDITIVVLFDKTSSQSKEDLNLIDNDIRNRILKIPKNGMIFSFDENWVRKILTERGYSLEYYEGIPNLFYGNIMMAYMIFFLNLQDFDYYWFCEWDVAFNGSWRRFLYKYDTIDDDFISRSCEDGTKYNPEWYHANQWKTTTLKPFTQNELMVTFNPIMRLSKRALYYLDDVYSKGNSGFYEIFLGTVLRREGFKIGGFKEYGDLDMRTFTWIPRDSIDIKNITGLNMLLHPVKSDIGIPMTREDLNNIRNKGNLKYEYSR